MIKRTYSLRVTIIIITFVLSLTVNCFSGEEDDALKFAIGAYNDGFYDIAEQGFSNFVNNYRFSENRPYALYLLGISRFNLKKYKSSQEALSELTQLYPKYERISLAHYFLGEASYLTDYYKGALQSYRYVYKNPPSEVERVSILFRVGELEFISGNYKRAENALSEIKSGYADFEHMNVVRLYLSLSYYYSKEFAKAFNEFKYVLTKPELIKDSSEDILLFTADSAFAIKKYDSSLKYYSEYLKKLKDDKKREPVRYYRAMSLYFTNDKETALKELKSYYKDYPKGKFSIEVVEQLANIYFEVKQYKRANEYFKKLIDERKGAEEIIDWLLKSAWCYTNLNDYKSASKIYERLEKEAGGKAITKDITFLRAEAYYLSKEYLKALEVYEKLEDDEKYKAEVLKKVGDSYFYLGDYYMSKRKITAFIKEYPSKVTDDIRLKLAISLQNEKSSKKDKEALKYYEKIISRNKKDYYYKTALYNAILIYEASGDEKSLIDALQKYIVLKDADVPTYFYLKLANSYFTQDSYKKASKYYDLAIKSNEREVMGESLFKLGRIYYKQNKLDKALEYFDLAESALTIAGNIKETVLIFIERGNIYEKKGALKKAKEEYKKVIDLGSDEELKKIALKRVEVIDNKLGETKIDSAN